MIKTTPKAQNLVTKGNNTDNKTAALQFEIWFHAAHVIQMTALKKKEPREA